MSTKASGRALRAGAAAVLLIGIASPAYADDSFQQCIDRAADHNGELPTCTEVNGHWVASWPGDGGPQGVMVLLLVVGILVTVGLTIWRVSTARRLAAQSGMDPGLATQMTLLSADGLDATYLASSLRTAGPAAEPSPEMQAAPHPTGAAERLTELARLLDAGLITQAEHDARRKAIIEAV